jgi:hypothetical protein
VGQTHTEERHIARAWQQIKDTAAQLQKREGKRGGG